ncbi:MAG: hypothetical protein HKN07_01645 [Acidimicrobiia bacterium]|nr:hypothetical protein [Acidimicrobiia bacterium]
MIRRFIALSCLLLATLPAASAFAAAGDTSAVDIVELEGPMDQRLLDFAVDAIESSSAQLVVLQIDSPGISSGDPTELRALLADPPVPLASYIGLRPARALGGAGVIALEAPVRIAAPGVEIGLLDPMVIRSDEEAPGGLPVDLYEGVEVVASTIPDVIDIVEPSLVQLIIDMDGVSFEVRGETVVLATAQTIVGDDGEAVTVPAGETRFVRPGLWTRFLRLASTPEATFLFLLFGLAAVAFEFYAAGGGLTAGIAALALFPAGYGLATLPIRWWAVGLTLIGLLLYTADFQQVRIAWRSLLGTLLLLVGGLALTDAAPQFSPKIWAVLLTVLGIAAFYGFAMTTVVRSRFSTRTIGRDHLVGRQGLAYTALSPEGTVQVEGALWRAHSTRAANIRQGDMVEIIEVRGIVLEVDPLEPEDERA